ncbi:MAG: hypothetical protein H0W09_00590 [Solirubrobacterales bacterium]|nr:hypothetical protein [Solirubrobacterales bacterium]
MRGVARRAREEAVAELEQCELCGEPIGAEHAHLLDLRTHQPMCACQGCRILFDRPAAGGGHYRLIGDRRLLLADFALDDVTWADLRIPVEMAFLLKVAAEPEQEGGEAELPGEAADGSHVQAFYPSPMGPTESLLELGAWSELERLNPVLREMEPEVEALLVNRARGARQHFIVPITDAYSLVALIRTRWRGLSGGEEVWAEIDSFFERLESGSKTYAKS